MGEKQIASATPLAAVEQSILTTLVRSALNSETIEVMTWEHEQLHGGAGTGNAIYRFSGQGRDGGQDIPWSLEHYGLVARHLGQFNGAYLVARRLPSWSWLSSGWLRQVVENSALAIPMVRDSLGHPLISRLLPDDAGDRYFRLWEERGIYLDALDRLPQTLCHMDISRRNLFARRARAGDYQTVAIDWAFAGRGALGEELVPLILGSVMFFEVGVDQAQALEEIAIEGYLEGLHDAGWQGDPRQVRLGYAAAGSLRYQFQAVGRWLALALDETLHPIVAQMWGMPIEEIIDNTFQVDVISDRLADEARELIGALA